MLKKLCLAVCALLLLCLFSGAAAENVELMTPEELALRLDQSPYYLNTYLFDVRPEEEYAAAHLPFSYNFPLDEMESQFQTVVENNRTVLGVEAVVYGDSEEAGIQAADILLSLGFRNVKRLQSMADWQGAVLSNEDEQSIFGYLKTMDIYGSPVDSAILSDNKLVMVNVWATYCQPCISEMADLGRLAQDMKAQGVQVVGLLSDAIGLSLAPEEDTLLKARQIVESTGADYPHLLPTKDLYWRVIGQITAVPTTFFVDASGRLVGYAYQGARSYDAWKAILEETLASLSAE